MRVLAWLAAATLAVQPALATAADETPPVARLRAELQSLVYQRQLPGAITIVRQKGRTLAHVRVGYQDMEAGKPLTDDAVFRLYSMTKPITSVAIMILVEEGRIELEAPVERYLPEFSG